MAKTAPKKAAKPVAKASTKTSGKKVTKPVAKTETKKSVSKPAAKKPAAKAEPKKAVKPVAKKTAAETKQKVFVQFGGKSEEQSKLVARAVKIWTKEMKKKEADLSSLDLYVKPEEGTVYIVFNKKERSQFTF